MTTESLTLYRTVHKIEVDRSGETPRCVTDGIPVYRVLSTRYQHDLNVIRRLVREEAEATVRELAVRPTSEEARVSAAIERITGDFAAYMGEDDDESDFDRESQPEFNGSFR